MKKIITTISIAMLSTIVAMAEPQRVAVFDPTGNVENHIKGIVREEITSVIVNSGNFIVLEREQIDQVLRENHFQTSGLVDDAQIIEMGRLMGANLVFLTNIAPHNENFHISGRMINVQTGRIERQRTAQTSRGTRDLVEVVERLTEDVVGISRNMLVRQGRNIFMGGIRLNQDEVRQLMVGTDALRLYNRGLQKNRNGNIALYSGLGAGISGVIVLKVAEERRFHPPTTQGGSGYYTYHIPRIPTVVGGVMIGAGIVSTVTGLIMNSSGRRDLKDAVNIHSRSLNRADSSIELNFGITPNGMGMGLVLNF